MEEQTRRNSGIHQRNLRFDRKMLKLTRWVFIVIVVCYLPYTYLSFHDKFVARSHLVNQLFVGAEFVLLTKPLWNCFINLFRLKVVKKEMLGLLCCHRRVHPETMISERSTTIRSNRWNIACHFWFYVSTFDDPWVILISNLLVSALWHPII